MNSKTFFILVIIALIGFFTNPTKEKHKQLIIEKTQEKAAKDFGIVGEISNKAGLTKVLIPDSDVIYSDYYVFSMTEDTDGHIRTIGFFTKIIYTKKD